MVKVAIAGGSGQVSQEIIDALLESKKHHITVLSRKEAPKAMTPGIHWQTVDYNNKEDLVQALQGIHTLLSFVQILSDPDQKPQMNLIDAAIAAGVKRFAPSEYGSKDTVDMAWWHGKEVIRTYLKEVNKDKKVLEYTLFQPGLFLDYLAYPYKTSKHVHPLQSIFDFEHRRAVIVEGHEDAIMTLTTVADVAAVVARAVDYEGEWPATGGIRGNRVTFEQVLEIGRRVRVKIEDLEAGNLKTSWGLEAVHQAVAADQAAAMLRAVVIGMLLSSSKGAWDISDEWNRILPDYEFTPIEGFLTKVWEGKP